MLWKNKIIVTYSYLQNTKIVSVMKIGPQVRAEHFIPLANDMTPEDVAAGDGQESAMVFSLFS